MVEIKSVCVQGFECIYSKTHTLRFSLCSGLCGKHQCHLLYLSNLGEMAQDIGFSTLSTTLYLLSAMSLSLTPVSEGTDVAKSYGQADITNHRDIINHPLWRHKGLF